MSIDLYPEPSVGGGAAVLDDLTDATIAAPADTEVVIYDDATSQWINRLLTTTDLPDLSALYQPKDTDLDAIAGLAPANDDIIQRKAGVWTNRTMAQLKLDLGQQAAIDAAIAALVGTAPGVLDTLGEISDAINDDANLYTTLTTLIATKAPLASPTFTGTVTVPNDSFTYAKLQNVSATDKLLGRSSAGAGDIEEIPLTAAGRALIDDADAAAQRTTLGLGNVDNVSDANKPVSTPQATAIAAKVDKATFDAHSILKADADDTPIVLPVAEQRVVGRVTGGSITDLTAAQLKAIIALVEADIPSTLLRRAAVGFINLASFPEDFSDAYWTKTRASITANAMTAPDGTTTADKLVEDASATTTHLVERANLFTSSTDSSWSIYAKAAERSWIRVGFRNASTSRAFYFDLTNGAVGTNGVVAGFTATITPVGDGWYRCTISSAGADRVDRNTPYVRLATGDGGESYTGDGASGVYIWGGQGEVSATPHRYRPATDVLLHHATHSTGGADAIAPADIGAIAVGRAAGNRTKKSGEYFGPDASALSTGTATLNTAKYMPITVSDSPTADRLGIEVVTAGAGSAIRLGIHSPDVDGRPGARLLDAGTVDSSTTGWKEATISQALPAGEYWLVAVAQGGTAPVVRTIVGFMRSVGHTNAATVSAACYTETIAAALPANATPVAGASTGFLPKYRVA